MSSFRQLACQRGEVISSGSLAYAPARPLACADDLVSAVGELWDVTTIADFLRFTRTDLRRLLPHSASGVVFGDLSRTAPRPLILTVGFPAQLHVNAVSAASASFFRPYVEAWRSRGQTWIFSASDRSVPYTLRRPLIETRLENIAAAGVFGGSSEYCSFFTFHGLPEPLQGAYKQIFECFLPHLHCALARILFSARPLGGHADQPNNGLTRREIEILDWVRQGKTNAEIAAILGISHGTVKVQVQHILVKLRVNTRGQAVVKALSKGFLSLTPGALYHY